MDNAENYHKKMWMFTVCTNINKYSLYYSISNNLLHQDHES